MNAGLPGLGKGQPRFFQSLELRGCAAVFVAALAWFLFVRPPELRPGPWLDAAASIEGLDPFRPLGRPLWTGLVTLGAAAGDGVAFAHLLSAIAAAGCAALLYLFLATLHFRHAHHQQENRQARFVSGIVAAAVSVLALPLSIVPAGINPHAVACLPLLGALALAAGFPRDGRLVRLYAGAFLCGLAVAEFPTAILLMPMVGLWWLVHLWRGHKLRAGPLLGALAFALAGLAPLFVNAWWYAQSPAASLREFDGFEEVLRYTVTGSWREMRMNIPRHGWLLMFLMTFVPAIVVFVQMLEQPLDKWTHIGRTALAGVLGIVAVLQLSGVNGSLVRMESAPSLVLVGLLCGAWIGRWAGALYILAGHAANAARTPLTLAATVWRLGLPLAVVAGALLAFLNRAPDDDTKARWALARAAVDRLDGRAWLVTSGEDDTLMALEARRRGLSLTLLDTSRGREGAYLKWIAGRLPDVRLRTLAEAGLAPVLEAWLRGPRDATRELAVLNHPSLWARRGFTMLPAGVLYRGTRTGETVSVESVLALNSPVWTNDLLRGSPRVARHAARVANDLGLWLAIQGHSNEAFRALSAARRFDDRNASVFLNLTTLGAMPAGAVGPFVTNALLDHVAAKAMHTLGEGSGFLLEPARWAAHGWPWAWSGALGDDLRARMIAMGGAPARSVARAQVLEGSPALGAAIFSALLERDPADREALAGLMRASVVRGELARARELIDRLDTNPAPSFAWAPERAAIELAEGQTNRARAILQAAVSNDPARADLWIGLLRIADLSGDEKLRDRAVAHLGSLPERPQVLLALSREAVRRSETDSARRWLEQVVASGEFRREALENLLSLDFHAGDTNGVREHARALLRIDPDHPLANYGIAGLYRASGRHDLAESAYRASLAALPAPYVWADLADLLLQAGRADEALTAADAAIALTDRQASAWEVRGKVLQGRGDEAGARAAFERARQAGAAPPESASGR